MCLHMLGSAGEPSAHSSAEMKAGSQRRGLETYKTAAGLGVAAAGVSVAVAALAGAQVEAGAGSGVAVIAILQRHGKHLR